jgi:hypothetical protein
MVCNDEVLLVGLNNLEIVEVKLYAWMDLIIFLLFRPCTTTTTTN